MSETDGRTENDRVRAVDWVDGRLAVLDQRRLPEQVVVEYVATPEGVAEAIAGMRVRGAPAIGIAAAYGVVLAARKRYAEDPARWKQSIEDDLAHLAAARPTAVNLFWALETMRRAFADLEGDPVPSLLRIAKKLHEDDVAGNRRMAKIGAELLTGVRGLLTHCNTGSLATGGYGTALGVIREAVKQASRKVYASETRPWLQGARLTVWELEQDGIPATLIADSAAACLMRTGAVQWVLVGADRIAANGDVANKIGTYSLAVNARYHGVRFMVVAPTSTIDWKTETGAAIPIELRERGELLAQCFQRADSVIDAWNPVFDVTPASLVDAIVTERGAVLHPDAQRMRAVAR